MLLLFHRPIASTEDPFKALVFDSNFDHYRGVVANIAVFGGRVKKGDKIVSAHLGKAYEVNELGLLRPDEHPTQKLYALYTHFSHFFSFPLKLTLGFISWSLLQSVIVTFYINKN